MKRQGDVQPWKDTVFASLNVKDLVSRVAKNNPGWFAESRATIGARCRNICDEKSCPTANLCMPVKNNQINFVNPFYIVPKDKTCGQTFKGYR